MTDLAAAIQEPIELIANPQIEEVVDPNAVDPAAQSAEPTPAEPKKIQNPLLAELTQQRARRREAEEKAARFEREATEAKAMLERMAKGTNGNEPNVQPKTVTTPDDAEIDRRADYKLFLRDVDTLRTRGLEKFGGEGFASIIRDLAAYGADSDEFVRAVLDVDRDNGHDLLHEISQDGARALGLAKMSPTQRIAELTRMSVARQAKGQETPKPAEKEVLKVPAKGISAAPKPAPAIAASTSQTLAPFSDKKDEKAFDEDFNRWATRFSRR